MYADNSTYIFEEFCTHSFRLSVKLLLSAGWPLSRNEFKSTSSRLTVLVQRALENTKKFEYAN